MKLSLLEKFIEERGRFMSEITIDSFKTEEGVRQLFESVGYIGEKNCFLYALNRDYVPGDTGLWKNYSFTRGATKMGGAFAGYFANSLMKAVDNELAQKQALITNPAIQLLTNTTDICGYVFNKTEKGYGFIPLSNDYKLITKLKDVKAHPELFAEITHQDIEKKTLKKIPLNFNRRIAQFKFNCESPYAMLTLTIYTKNDVIEYQEKNCAILMSEGV